MTKHMRQLFSNRHVYHLGYLYRYFNAVTNDEKHNVRGCISSLSARGDIRHHGYCLWGK